MNAARRVLFRIRHPSESRLAGRVYDVVFCCDPIRWQNIKLVVQELLRRRPELRIAVAVAGARGSIADLEALAGVTTIAHVTQSTLPTFRTKILYFPAPDLPAYLRPDGAVVVHALMSMASLDGLYLDHHFDGFDYVLCGGPHHIEALRLLVRRRPSLEGLRLIRAGYPKLDLMLAAPETRLPRQSSSKATAVYAPTHVIPSNERLASLRRHGERIVGALLAGGYRVIFRPHPMSFMDQDRALIEKIDAANAGNPDYSLDRSKDYTRSYASADFMVTDLSGTGFTYSLTFARPCMFFAADEEAERGLNGAQFDDRHRIGTVVRDMSQLLPQAAELSRTDMTGDLLRFRGEFVFNAGHSAAQIVSALEDILAGRDPPDTVRL